MSNLVKYPRTMNLPWSESNSSDDVWWTNCDPFVSRRIVITEKIDGECTTMYRDHIHARSVDSNHHVSRDWVKRLHGRVQHDLPDGWRVCGENVYAYHSVFYDQLPSYFFVFGIYDETNTCISWDDTLFWCEMLDLEPAPIIYSGEWDEKHCRAIWEGRGAFPTFASSADYPKWPEDFVPTKAEGYVVRLAESFNYGDFRHSAAKYVRPNHVAPNTEFWMKRAIIPNGLKEVV